MGRATIGQVLAVIRSTTPTRMGCNQMARRTASYVLVVVHLTT